jgi:hypothetical protein
MENHEEEKGAAVGPSGFNDVLGDWFELNLPYWCRKNDGQSFEGLDLNKPGTLIETDSGIFLIGHINPLKGVCDDCVEFSTETIVKRYKIIWSEAI